MLGRISVWRLAIVLHGAQSIVFHRLLLVARVLSFRRRDRRRLLLLLLLVVQTRTTSHARAQSARVNGALDSLGRLNGDEIGR